MAKATDSHGPDIRVRDLPLDAVEQSHDRAIGQNVVQILGSKHKHPLLFFVNVVDLGQFGRQYGLL